MDRTDMCRERYNALLQLLSELTDVPASAIASGSRKHIYVVPRHFIIHTLVMEGYKHMEIGEAMHINQSGVCYARARAEDIAQGYGSYQEEVLWHTYQERLSQLSHRTTTQTQSTIKTPVKGQDGIS